jgi:hypothetical protein
MWRSPGQAQAGAPAVPSAVESTVVSVHARSACQSSLRRCARLLGAGRHGLGATGWASAFAWQGGDREQGAQKPQKPQKPQKQQKPQKRKRSDSGWQLYIYGRCHLLWQL